MPSSSNVEANKELVQTELREVLEHRNFAFVDDIYDETVEIRTQRVGEGPLVSRADIKDHYAEWTHAFPDLTVEVNEAVAEGDVVVTHVTLKGTHEGNFRGIDSTGAVITVDGFHLREIQDGKIVATSSMVGMATLLEQLGFSTPSD